MDLTRIFKNEIIPEPLTYLNDLAEAVLKVTEYYCNWQARHIALQQAERVFAYELYHQFKLLIASKREYEGIRFDGEIGKQIHQQANNCGTTINTRQLVYSPDLVLHKSQTDILTVNQKLIVVIKARNITDIELSKDIIKLNHYITTLNFQYAVFISVNTNKSTIERKLKRLLPFPSDKVLVSNFKKIIILNYKDRVLSPNRLYDILEK